LEGTPDIVGQKALQEAAKLAGADLASLPAELDKRAHVLVTISGLTSFETLSKLQKDLSTEHGVKDQFLRSYAQESGLAVLDVLTDQLSAQEVADLCVRLGGPTWSVYQVTGRSAQVSTTQAGR
jgi:hypothetical protein